MNKLKNNSFYASCEDYELYCFWKIMTKEVLVRMFQKLGA